MHFLLYITLQHYPSKSNPTEWFWNFTGDGSEMPNVSWNCAAYQDFCPVSSSLSSERPRRTRTSCARSSCRWSRRLRPWRPSWPPPRSASRSWRPPRYTLMTLHKDGGGWQISHQYYATFISVFHARLILWAFTVWIPDYSVHKCWASTSHPAGMSFPLFELPSLWSFALQYVNSIHSSDRY